MHFDLHREYDRMSSRVRYDMTGYRKVPIVLWVKWSFVQLHVLVFIGMVLREGDPWISAMNAVQFVCETYVVHICAQLHCLCSTCTPSMLILALTCPSAWCFRRLLADVFSAAEARETPTAVPVFRSSAVATVARGGACCGGGKSCPNLPCHS